MVCPTGLRSISDRDHPSIWAAGSASFRDFSARRGFFLYACGDLWHLLGSASNATPRRQILGRNLVPHCTKCGTTVADNVEFCPSCGAPQAGGVATAMAPAASTQSGMSENVAGLLCYLLGWITGLIFFLIDKRPFVRFHAAQSIVVFGGLTVIRIVLSMLFISGGLAGVAAGAGILWLLSLIGFGLLVFLFGQAGP